MAKRSTSKPSTTTIVNFDQYQEMVERTDERKKTLVSLLGLASELGDINATFKKLALQQVNPTLRQNLQEDLGDILWYLTSLANLHQISLVDVARSSAEKAEHYYAPSRLIKFDSEYSEDERIPRNFKVTFSETRDSRKVLVRININGVIIGDALSDNAHSDDGYRYHDVFHFANAAVLGWSPVARSILRRKRKSNPRVDEIEDGGRAVVVEEALSILLFNEAPQRGWYTEESSVDIGLLKTIARLTAGLEVHQCPAKLWKRAIHQGYRAFIQLRDHRGGSVLVDLDQQTIVFSNE